MARGRVAKRRDDLLDHPPGRLKPREVKEWREKLVEDQFYLCPLCGLRLNKEDAVLDHCHKTGLVRGALHSGCNAMLGKLENAHIRMGKMFSDEQFMSMAPSSWYYVTADYHEMPLHPTWRTQEEKRLSRNERARLKRAASKKKAARRKRVRGA